MSLVYPSYPPLDPSSLHPEQDVKPRPLTSLQSSPLPLSFPPLPSPVRNPVFAPSYTLTTHLYPSAFPREPSTSLPRASYADIPGETKTERKARQGELVRKLWARAARADKAAQARDEPEVLWNAVNRFVRKDAGHRAGRVTLFLAHATGFPKETWEPSLLEIFSRAETVGVVIDEVWAFDAVQHGDSALVNDPVIGDVFYWADNARDILSFLLYHLPSNASPAALPTHLPRLSENIALQRKTAGYKDRILVGIAHSMGGCSTARAALAHPSLFASLILVDPVIAPIWAPVCDQSIPAPMAVNAIRRRAGWRSREEAMSEFQKSPFFASWALAVLEKYIQHGLEPDPTAGSKDAVRLKMSGGQEAIVFLNPRLSYEMWQLLPKLDQRIEIRFVMSGKETFAVGGDRAVRELVWRRPGNVSNVIIPEVGHLIPQEAPEIFATLVIEFLERKYGKPELQARKAML